MRCMGQKIVIISNENILKQWRHEEACVWVNDYF